MSDRIEQELRRIDQPGAFAARHRESALGLAIRVDGVEHRLPLTEDRVRELVRAAVPSPFGYGDETRYDRSVRDSWEIPAPRVELVGSWAVRLRRGVDALARALGFPPETVARPTFQKLLVYEPGQFFVRHRDTEKEPGTAATLVVVLPGTYEGGEVVVAHQGEEVTFSTADEPGLTLLAFYVDCLHETRPVGSGHRVALTYTLDAAEARPVLAADRERALAARLAERFADEPDGWLVYVLEHQYSEQSLRWGRLKNGDRPRTEALRRAAAAVGCECFLALATAVETFSLGEGEPDDDDAPARPPEAPWWRLGWAEEPSEVDAWPGDGLAPEPEVDLEPIVDGPGGLEEVTLTGWIGEDGQPRAGPEGEVDATWVVTLADSGGWASFDASAEPWTGNEGGVAAKWFHVAALVVIPPGAPDRPEPASPDPRRRTTLRRPRT